MTPASITIPDWEFIKGVIEGNDIRSVLEFGFGFSTVMFNELDLDRLVCYETERKRLPRDSDIDIRLWDGKDIFIYGGFKFFDSGERYDLGFVDGPAGGENREWSTKWASELCDHVIVHDYDREWERKWQRKYIHGPFDMVVHCSRCAWWSKQ